MAQWQEYKHHLELEAVSYINTFNTNRATTTTDAAFLTLPLKGLVWHWSRHERQRHRRAERRPEGAIRKASRQRDECRVSKSNETARVIDAPSQFDDFRSVRIAHCNVGSFLPCNLQRIASSAFDGLYGAG